MTKSYKLIKEEFDRAMSKLEERSPYPRGGRTGYGSEEQQQNYSKNQIENDLEPEKLDQIRQAEAILNAIKGQEKINQKNKILKSKSFKLDKDW